MHSALSSAGMHWCWSHADLYEERICTGVFAMARACCQPVLQSITEQWVMHSALSTAAMHWCWSHADLYEERISIGVFAAFGTTVAWTARSATRRSLQSMGTIEEALVAAGATQADLDAILLKLEDPHFGCSRHEEAMSYFKKLDAAILTQPPNALNVRRCNIVQEAQKLPQGVNTAPYMQV